MGVREVVRSGCALGRSSLSQDWERVRVESTRLTKSGQLEWRGRNCRNGCCTATM